MNSTSSFTWKDSSLARSADFILGGKLWYNVSLLLGAIELDRATWWHQKRTPLKHNTILTHTHTEYKILTETINLQLYQSEEQYLHSVEKDLQAPVVVHCSDIHITVHLYLQIVEVAFAYNLKYIYYSTIID